ncbi:peptidoglycan glycosyltransferase [Sulfurimonas gotlandica GD1]|uniref:Peptidoglycan glycosyltransferase n=1 Tax=Sulfurimonas gotlandica (strain DSM 19862 / JCM 16533 / GD1) TaxID=929558 RepID=B6BJG9_SULGG|nr:penicillin-binding protein 2 [Sulfurimonas gotlandica]EDZ62699.1 penicillin-binding protein 2 [Sulfurimonas gotlandica GD1]EHP31215.1 peptidoglycan glycosyltransferase [Sulfurimonas gotlandica GD1]
MKIKFILAIFIITWLTLIVRVFFLAVESNTYYENLSHSNTIKSEKIAPVRGEIVDRNNRPVAINELGFKIQLRPHLRLKKNIKIFNEEIDNIVKLLPNLNRERLIADYIKKDSYYNHNYIDIVHFISNEDIMPVYSVLSLRENVNIVPAPKRYYPYGDIGSHTIGYVSRANKKDIKDDKLLELIGYTGKTGIENYYNTYLQGEAGEREIKVNANNQEIEELSYVGANEDRKLTLSIDIEFQKYVSSLFDKKAGAVIVMGVDGAILAASSFPEYDLNTFVSGISHEVWNKLSKSLDKPFTNKLVNGLYPPGSTIKTGLGLLYITTDIDKTWTVDCRSSMPLGKRVFRCWKKDGHRITGIKKAIRESCDDFFYKGSLQVGIKKMSEGLMRYGLGKKTGVDLPNEFIGVVPSRDWKRKRYNRPWFIGETVNTSIGQGDFLVTPMQIAQFTALMATSKLPTPHFAKSIGTKPYQPLVQEVLTEEELKKLPLIQQAMYEVCNYPKGTATQYLSSKVSIAGKTGTAQVVTILQDIEDRVLEHEMSYYNRSHAWFTSYGPYKNPQYVVLAMVEHGGHGGAAAGEIVSKIYNKLLELKYIK